MKSKTSFFNGTLCSSTFKRFWPIFAAYPVTWLLTLAFPLNSMLKWSAVSGGNEAYNAAEFVINSGHIGGPLISAVFGLLFAMAAASYLYNSRSVSMMCSLPLSRGGTFLSVAIPGLVGMLLSNLVVFAITYLIQISYGVNEIGYLLQWLAMVCLMNLFFYGFAIFCASLTGHILVLPALYIVLNFTAIVVTSLVYQILSIFVYGMSLSESSVMVGGMLSPLFSLLFRSGVMVTGKTADSSVVSYSGWSYLIIIAAAGVVLAMCAVLLIKHRRMETAGDVVAIRPLKPVFKYCLCFGCALVFGILIFSLIFAYGYGSVSSASGIKGALFLLICMLFGAFIGYFAAEMMIQKTLKVFSARKWIGLGISALLLIVFVMGCEFDIFGYERSLPETEDVESVTSSVNGSFVTISDPGDIQAMIDVQRGIISHKSLYESSEILDEEGAYSITFSLHYYLKNGSEMKRKYSISTNVPEDMEKLNELLNKPSVILNRNSITIPVTDKNIASAYINYFDAESSDYTDLSISPGEAYELYTQCILPDMKDGTIGLLWLDQNDSGYLEESLACNINIEFFERRINGENNYQTFYTTPTINSQRTNRWLEEHGIKLKTQNEAYSSGDYTVQPTETHPVPADINY